MVKTTLATSIAIIQFALLSQVSVGLPIPGPEQSEHCQSKRSGAGIAAGIGCGALGAAAGIVGHLTRPPVPASAAQAAKSDAQANGGPTQPVDPKSITYRQEQAMTPHGHTSDPDAITPAPPLPPITSKTAPITRQPGSSHMEYQLPEMQRVSTLTLGDHGRVIPAPQPAHLAQPKGSVKRRDLTRLVRRQPGRSLERREWDELRSRRLDSNSYLDELD